jgi:outer membrane biosynthesis protein TonB
VGDLAIAKPETESRKGEGAAEQPRPRTLQEARARQSRNQLVGEKMRQEGGVHRLRIDAAFDAKGTPLGGYDHAMIEAITQRWFDLLESRYNYDRNGRVVISFRLSHDGTVSNIRIEENTVEEKLDGMLAFLCQKAVSDPAPYPRWPRELRLTVGRDYRDLTFTFYYR